jgi:hypothetical protein
VVFEVVRTDCSAGHHVFEAPAQLRRAPTYLLLHRTFDCLICRSPQIVTEVTACEVISRDLFAWLLDSDPACP